MCASLIGFLLIIASSDAIASPIGLMMVYEHSIELQSNVSYLWWSVNETKQLIIFELHINTTGWIALGISPGNSIQG